MRLRSTDILLAAAFVATLSPSCLAQRADPPAMGHIEQKGGIIDEKGIDPRTARENREREREHRKALKLQKEEWRKKQAARDKARTQRDTEVDRQVHVKLEAKAKERAALEAKIKAAIFANNAVVGYIDSSACQFVFTNTTSYWAIVVRDYTVVITDQTGSTMSHQHQAVLELPPRQTRTWPVWAVFCGSTPKWEVLGGGTLTVKDNLNNYPFHLR